MRKYVVVREGNKWKVAKTITGKETCYSIVAIIANEDSAELVAAALNVYNPAG